MQSDRNRTRLARDGFTLIEIMVVIAIIGLLVAVLLPAFGTVRTRARVVQTKGLFSALDTGLVLFRSEERLAAGLPPSHSDNPSDPQLIADPRGQKSQHVRIAGAHLLVHALLGADGLGPPGFRDLDQDGVWWNDTYGLPVDGDGAYALDADGNEKRTRYGGTVSLDDKVKETVKSLRQLDEEGVIVNLETANSQGDMALDEPMFLDPWGGPVLYYKANTASRRIVSDSEHAGVYRQEDNGIITGTVGSSGEPGASAQEGLDFGAGKIEDRYHAMSGLPPLPTDPTTAVADILTQTTYDGSFVRYILDPTVKARPTPVRKQDYLLISAGPDVRYGTEDDVTNWTRTLD